MPSIDPVEVLSATPLFANPPADDLAALAASCGRRYVAAGEPVLVQGGPGDALPRISPGSMHNVASRRSIEPTSTSVPRSRAHPRSISGRRATS